MIHIAVDARTAQSGITSGISRFVVGLTTALAAKLNDHNPKEIKILIVLKSTPPDWVTNLVQTYPRIVSFQVYGPRFPDKPIWFWSTFAFRKIQKSTDNQAIWFAPANFDRPLFLSKKDSSKVIQVIHDTIPLQKENGVGLLFRTQFQYFVKRALKSLPFIATVSKHSAKNLQDFVPTRTFPIHIISDAIDPEFGAEAAIADKNVLIHLKKNFIDEIASMSSESIPIFRGDWILGVGRNQIYKAWNTTLQAVIKLHTEEHKDIWFIRVGANQDEITNYSQKCAPKNLGPVLVFESLRTIVLPVLSESSLVQIYRLSQLFVHPSRAEGFGLSPLESAFCGTPVLFQTGTAIDDHLLPYSLPENFWCGIDSCDPKIWADHIQKRIDDKKDSSFFRDLYHSDSTRKFIISYAKCRNFEWKESVSLLLNLIDSIA